jgi:predicted DNA binding protein
MNDRLRRAPVGVLETTRDGEVTAVNETAIEVLDTDVETLVGSDVRDTFPRSAAGTMSAVFAADPDERSFEEYYPGIDRWLAVDVVPDADSVVVYVRDRSRRRADERRVDRLERRLDRMRTIDSLVATVLRTVIGASTREEVSRTLCERLGTTDLYEFTLVCERALGDDSLQVVASAGGAPETRDRVEDALDAGAPVPERATATTGNTQAVEAIPEDDSLPRPVRLAAFGRGLQSCLAVPLSYRDTVYGVLSVYSGREGGFGEGERASLETLGATAGFAINAIRQEGLLFADTVTELTLRVDDETVPLVTAARAAECDLSLTGAVPREDDTLVCYVQTTGDPETVVDALADHPDVVDRRVVSNGEDTASLEVTVTGGTPVTTLTAWGATVRTAEYDRRGVRLVAQVPADGELRRVVEAVDDTFCETDVLAKERTTREPETVEAFRTDLEERLTDRQLTVLHTAYLSDYFTSPRRSTAEEVAEALDVTGPTVLYHLRRAQRKLLDAFFTTGLSGEDPNGRP